MIGISLGFGHEIRMLKVSPTCLSPHLGTGYGKLRTFTVSTLMWILFCCPFCPFSHLIKLVGDGGPLFRLAGYRIKNTE